MDNTTAMDPRLVVALYAAVVSTLALAWNVYQFIRTQRAVLRIQIGFSADTLELRITNLGSTGRYLYTPQIVWGRQIGEHSAYELWGLRSEHKYPVPIAAGEVLRLYYSLTDLCLGFREMRKDLKRDDNFRFKITDTRHRVFYSPRLEITRFLDPDENK